MRSYRRMATVAVLGALTAAALSSCGLTPDTAATVGSTTITEKQVDEVLDSVKAHNVPRERVVQDMVLGMACKNYAAAHKISFDTAAAAAEWAQQGVPSGGYQQALALRSGCLAAVAGTPGTQPSDDDLKRLYDDVVRINPTVLGPFDQAKAGLRQNSVVASAFAARYIAEQADVSVNPRYRTMNVPVVILGNQVAMQIQLGEEANPAITDAPKPLPTQAPLPPTS